MKLKILTMSTVVLFMNINIITAQCNIASIQASSIQNGDCNNLYFQSGIGSIVQPYGSCGGLYFGPPFTGSEQSNATSEHTQLSILVYPNPVKSSLEIKILEMEPNLKVELISITGNLISTYLINEDLSTIDVSDLLQGVYFLRFYSNGKYMAYKKFIKI